MEKRSQLFWKRMFCCWDPFLFWARQMDSITQLGFRLMVLRFLSCHLPKKVSRRRRGRFCVSFFSFFFWSLPFLILTVSCVPSKMRVKEILLEELFRVSWFRIWTSEYAKRKRISITLQYQYEEEKEKVLLALPLLMLSCVEEEGVDRSVCEYASSSSRRNDFFLFLFFFLCGPRWWISTSNE